MHVNLNLRQQLATKIMEAKSALRVLTESREYFQVSLDEMLKSHEKAVLPQKAVELVDLLENNQTSGVELADMMDSIN